MSDQSLHDMTVMMMALSLYDSNPICRRFHHLRGENTARETSLSLPSRITTPPSKKVKLHSMSSEKRSSDISNCLRPLQCQSARVNKRRKIQGCPEGITHNLIKEDAADFLMANSQGFCNLWLDLLNRTTLSQGTSVSKFEVSVAVRALEDAISSRSAVVARAGCVQLSCFIECLEQKISDSKGEGLVSLGSGRGCASAAMDLYINMHGDSCDGLLLRRRLHERKRIGKRWRMLVQTSPLLLLIYSKTTDVIVKSPSMSQPNFLKLVSETISNIPPPILGICTRIGQTEKALHLEDIEGMVKKRVALE